MFQSTVNISQSFGVPGDFYDLSPMRVLPAIGVSKSSNGATATATVTFADVAAEGDTISVGSDVFTFAAPEVGDDADDSAAALAAGLVALGWTATASSAVVTITAKIAGDEGNATYLASSSTNATLVAFSGGVDTSITLPTLGRVHTLSVQPSNGPLPIASVPTVICGGTGAFQGIFVNNKDQANIVGNLTATQSVPSGTVISIASMGHIVVEIVGANVQVGWLPTYNTTTGQISGVASGSAPSGYALIPNAKFVANGGEAGRYAVIELNHA